MFFKRKKKISIESKYIKGDTVNFKHHGELTFGIICNVKANEEGTVLYDIQIGGECPSIIYNVKEDIVRPAK